MSNAKCFSCGYVMDSIQLIYNSGICPRCGSRIIRRKEKEVKNDRE